MNTLRPLVAAVVLGTAVAPLAAQEHPTDPAAMKAFTEVVTAYRARPAWTAKTTIKINLQMGEVQSREQEVTGAITSIKGEGAVIKLRGYTCWLAGGKLNAVHDETDHSYFSIPDDDSPYYAMFNAFVDIPFPHMAIAIGEPEVDDFFCMQFHPKAPYMRPTAVTDDQDEKGVPVRRIKMSSDNGTIEMVVDAKTKLIRTLDLVLTDGPFVQSGTSLTYQHRFEYETYEEQPVDRAVLAFDPAQRQRVDLLATLAPAPAAPAGGAAGGDAPAGPLVGGPAPALILATADGGAVDLEELKGQVVVLDFWATWCRPCRNALPLLHEVADWARQEGLPVKVITVNVFEAGRGGEDTPDNRLAAVRGFWEAREFTLPVAMDFTDEVAAAYGVRGIPATVIIRSDGTVHAQHTGAGQGYKDMLKGEIKDALAALEK